jgi:hypothetical protein
MTLSEMREELLGQHRAIREIIEEARECAEQGAAGVLRASTTLRGQLERLHDALTQHNAREEELLRHVIRHVDAWGDVRETLLGDHHRGEHIQLVEALDRAVGTTDGAEGARQVLGLLQEIVEHMRQEEEQILSPKVLTDDIVIDNSFGG